MTRQLDQDKSLCREHAPNFNIQIVKILVVAKDTMKSRRTGRLRLVNKNFAQPNQKHEIMGIVSGRKKWGERSRDDVIVQHQTSTALRVVSMKLGRRMSKGWPLRVTERRSDSERFVRNRSCRVRSLKKSKQIASLDGARGV